MDLKWEFKSGVPIYQQIIEKLSIRIANGSYPPGSRIPAVRELALEAGVNPNTMQRALTELERDGLLAAQRTAGRFVTEDEGRLALLRESLSEDVVDELCVRLLKLGMKKEDILEAVRKGLEKK